MLKSAFVGAAAVLAASCATTAEAGKTEEAQNSVEAAAIEQASAAGAYAPMAFFAPFSGKTFRGEWKGEDGKTYVDIAKYEMILNGRALQSTHRLQDVDYGGRTIFFYDEGAKKYVFHYFTTAGFHTSGSADFIDDGLVTEEKVEGASDVAFVRSKSTFGEDAIEIDVVYVGKDGSETPGGHRIYKEIADPGPLYSDTK